MEKKLWSCMNLALLIFALLIYNQAIGQTTTEVEKETENLRKVTQHFYDHDLPAQMANDVTIKFDAYHIKKNEGQYLWPTAEMQRDALKCKNSLYLVEATTKNHAMKYLYCMNNKTIKLISTYELKSKNWTKL